MKLHRQQPDRPTPRGTYASLITPRREGEVEVDLGAMLETLDFVAARGAAGVVLFGSTGEFLHFTPEERSRFVGLAAKRSRVPVLVNVSHSTLDGAVALAEEAAGSGVAGVLAMPPFFYRYEPDSLREFYLQFVSRVAKWTPVYIDNVPEFSNPLPVDVAEVLLASGQFAGIKDSSGGWSTLERLLPLPVRVLAGNELLYTRALRAGAAGGVFGLATAVPELLSALDRAVTSGDDAAVERLDAWLADLVQWVRRFPSPVAIRQASMLRGLKAGGPAVPLGEERRALLDEFSSWFRGWIKVIEQECKYVPAR